MNAFAALSAPVDAAQTPPATPPTAAEMAKRASIGRTASQFEASFLSSMFQNMFEGVTTSAPFGGGEGEKMWTSMLADAMGKQVAKRGGIGISSAVTREMLHMQGLSETVQ